MTALHRTQFNSTKSHILYPCILRISYSADMPYWQPVRLLCKYHGQFHINVSYKATSTALGKSCTIHLWMLKKKSGIHYKINYFKSKNKKPCWINSAQYFLRKSRPLEEIRGMYVLAPMSKDPPPRGMTVSLSLSSVKHTCIYSCNKLLDYK